MKFKFFVFTFLSCIAIAFSQEIISPDNKEEIPFNYLNLEEEFDLIVDFTMVNPECATEEQAFYSLIIGTTVVGDYIERVTVLVPCLSNEYVKGELITIKPMKTPENVVYAVRTYLKDDQEIREVFGSEFRAIWGEVIKVY